MTIRSDYLAAAELTVDSLEHPAVAEHWDRPSALHRMSVGDLAAHLARSIHLVRAFLDADDPVAPDPITAEAYLGVLGDSTDLDSQVNAGIRRRSHDDAGPGPDGVAHQARESLRDLTDRLPAVPPQRQVLAFAGQAMTLDEYLRTRLVEIAVHHDDLQASLPPSAVLPEMTGDARARAVDLLVGMARRDHGDLAVLRALTRRERDANDVLRVI